LPSEGGSDEPGRRRPRQPAWPARRDRTARRPAEDQPIQGPVGRPVHPRRAADLDSCVEALHVAQRRSWPGAALLPLGGGSAMSRFLDFTPEGRGVIPPHQWARLFVVLVLVGMLCRYVVWPALAWAL